MTAAALDDDRSKVARAWVEQHSAGFDMEFVRYELEHAFRVAGDTLIELTELAADLARASSRTRRNGATPSVASSDRQLASPENVGAAALAPQNIDAEDAVLAGLLATGGLGVETSRSALAKTRAAGLTAGMFYRVDRGGAIYAAIEAVVARGEPCESLLVEAELERRGRLADAGGRARIRELAALGASEVNVGHRAALVVEKAQQREALAAVDAVRAAILDGGLSQHPELVDRVRVALVASVNLNRSDRLTTGGSFVLDTDATLSAVWGHSRVVAWAAGEGLMLVGPQGVGKTTLCQQLTLARVGIRDHVLGLPVERSEKPVLYIAADRPRQAKRSFARMVGEEHRETLDQLLMIWPGPLPFNVLDGPDQLAELALKHGAGTIVIDSLKDLAPGLASDEVGARVNAAHQMVLAAGLELLVLHHQRKATGDNKRPDKLADVYGSTFLTAGMGSVILLWGNPGDPIVELRHLKQPAEELGPWNVTHDHARGLSTLHEPVDLQQLLRDRGTDGLTAQDAATALYGAGAVKSEIEKARRRLRTLEGEGHAERIPGIGLKEADRWVTTGGRQQELQP